MRATVEPSRARHARAAAGSDGEHSVWCVERNGRQENLSATLSRAVDEVFSLACTENSITIELRSIQRIDMDLFAADTRNFPLHQPWMILASSRCLTVGSFKFFFN